MRVKSATSLYPCLNIHYEKSSCECMGVTHTRQKGFAMKEIKELQEAIGIIGAMDEETDPLLEAAQIKGRRVVAGMEYCDILWTGHTVP